MTFPLVSLVLPVCPYLFPLPEGLPGTLAFFTATISLVLYARVWNKWTPTVGTSNSAAHGPLLGETIILQQAMPQNRIMPWASPGSALHLVLILLGLLS